MHSNSTLRNVKYKIPVFYHKDGNRLHKCRNLIMVKMSPRENFVKLDFIKIGNFRSSKEPCRE